MFEGSRLTWQKLADEVRTNVKAGDVNGTTRAFGGDTETSKLCGMVNNSIFSNKSNSWRREKGSTVPNVFVMTGSRHLGFSVEMGARTVKIVAGDGIVAVIFRKFQGILLQDVRRDTVEQRRRMISGTKEAFKR